MLITPCTPLPPPLTPPPPPLPPCLTNPPCRTHSLNLQLLLVYLDSHLLTELLFSVGRIYIHIPTRKLSKLKHFLKMYLIRRRLVVGSRYYSIFHPGFMIEGRKKVRPLVDCDQSLFFSRFIEGSASARERRAAKPRDARNEEGFFRTSPA